MHATLQPPERWAALLVKRDDVAVHDGVSAPERAEERFSEFGE
ncbi:hypothetical protein Rrhod_3963 [Rhodococcus rhodnii LMG 5362]|uniref:Uncharacterized protein n=1 Tax=Rhodococcus rhodnii LMG 5362 TaxID=1273125 RepID=R7WHV3_9NOCA|nr:hypothetical protein Rrhod_3963 [Rhodococcus rhodnii LMG 5362]